MGCSLYRGQNRANQVAGSRAYREALEPVLAAILQHEAACGFKEQVHTSAGGEQEKEGASEHRC